MTSTPAYSAKSSISSSQDFAVSELPHSKLPHFTTQGVVKVLVGPVEEEFSIHRALLLDCSGFFPPCLTNGMRETAAEEVKFPEDEPDAFRIIGEPLYLATQSLSFKNRDYRENTLPEQALIHAITTVDWLYKIPFGIFGHDIPWSSEITYVKAWVLADKLRMTRCKNSIIDMITDSHFSHPVKGDVMQLIRDFRVDKEGKISLDENMAICRFYLDKHTHDLMYNARNVMFSDANMMTIREEEDNFLTRGGLMGQLLRRVLLKNYEESSWCPRTPDQSLYDICKYHDHYEDDDRGTCSRVSACNDDDDNDNDSC